MTEAAPPARMPATASTSAHQLLEQEALVRGFDRLDQIEGDPTIMEFGRQMAVGDGLLNSSQKAARP